MNDTYDQGSIVDYAPVGQEGNGFAVASLILGLVCVVLMCIWYIAIPCAILAIVFGVVGRSKARRGARHGGMATAGLILGGAGLLLPILIIGGCLAVLGLGGPELLDSIQEAAEQMQTSMPTTPVTPN